MESLHKCAFRTSKNSMRQRITLKVLKSKKIILTLSLGQRYNKVNKSPCFRWMDIFRIQKHLPKVSFRFHYLYFHV